MIPLISHLFYACILIKMITCDLPRRKSANYPQGPNMPSTKADLLPAPSNQNPLVDRIVQVQKSNVLAPPAQQPSHPGGGSGWGGNGGAGSMPGNLASRSTGGGGLSSSLNAGKVSAGQGATWDPNGANAQRNLGIGNAFQGSQSLSGSRTGDGGFQGGGGSNINIAGRNVGDRTDVGTDKNGNTNVNRKIGVDGIATSERQIDTGNGGFGTQTKRCLFGVCSQTGLSFGGNNG